MGSHPCRLFPESLRWLLATQHYRRSKAMMLRIARKNRVDMTTESNGVLAGEENSGSGSALSWPDVPYKEATRSLTFSLSHQQFSTLAWVMNLLPLPPVSRQTDEKLERAESIVNARTTLSCRCYRAPSGPSLITP